MANPAAVGNGGPVGGADARASGATGGDGANAASGASGGGADSGGDSSGASIEFRMPSLGADMAAGTVVQWRVKPGDRVKRGDIVAEVETEKGVFEVDLPFGGTVRELVVPVGSKVPVGSVLARLRPDGAAIAPAAVASVTAAPAVAAASPDIAPAVAAASPAPVAPPAPAVRPPAAVIAAARVASAPVIAPAVAPEHPTRRASPAARRLASERGIALETIEGTGPAHVIRLEDVQRAIAAPLRAEPTPVPRTPSSYAVAAAALPSAPPRAPAVRSMRQAIAAAVSRSKREIPHYYLSADVDLAATMSWLAARNAMRAVTERLIPAPLLLKAVAVALRRYPDLNGAWVDDDFRPAASVDIGVLVSLRSGGLIAPVLRGVDTQSLDDLMTALRDLVQRARGGGLRTSELTDATVTVTNLGDEGAESVFGVIYPPQVAIVGFGRIAERPWAVGGLLGVRPIVTVTLAADHRATDGHYGGRFLAEVDRLLQHPESL